MSFKVGVIGAGGAGRLLHLPALKQVEGVEIVALADSREERAQKVAQAFGVPKACTDYRELLAEDLDLVTIGLPNYLHAEVSCAALEAGKHVLVEKPLADTLEHGRQMVACAKKTGKHLFMGVQFRQSERARTIREMVLKGKLGEVYHANCSILRRRGYPGIGSWFTSKKLSGGGCLLDIGVHILDLAWYMLAEPKPERAVAMVYNKFNHLPAKPSSFGDFDPKGVVDVDDLAAGFIVFEGGLSVALAVSWALNAEQSGFKANIYGTKAGASFDPFRIYGEENGVCMDVAPQVSDERSNYLAEMQHFVNVCKGKEKPVVTPEAALTVQAMLEALYRSSALGREVAVEV